MNNEYFQIAIIIQSGQEKKKWQAMEKIISKLDY